MRTFIVILSLLLVSCAFASIKDKRKGVKISPELSQEQVTRQQGNTERLDEIGGVPERTDDTGYRRQQNVFDPESERIAAMTKVANGHSVEDIVSAEREQRLQATQAPVRKAFGGIWALLAGLLLAVGAWFGMQKFGPKPPAHVR
jgi:hypothetical protein